MAYVPFLKIKQGEFSALEELPISILNEIKPYHLFINDSNDERKGDYFSTFANPLIQVYGDRRGKCFVDFNSFTSIPLMDICDFMRNNSIDFTYVTRELNLESDVAMQLRDKGMCQDGLAVLIDYNQRQDLTDLNDRIERAKIFFDLKNDSIDLIIQFGFLTSGVFDSQSLIFSRIQNQLSGFQNFRTVVVSSGSFPKDVSPLAIDSITDLPRYEVHLFESLKKLAKRDLTFGDHGNLHCIYDAKAGKFEGSASLKYTTKNSYRVYRGGKPSEHSLGNGQYIVKCQQLVASEVYDGSDYSFGDSEIYRCATDSKAKPGSAKTWIRNTLNHHITRASREFS